jgi:hypothetical protein
MAKDYFQDIIPPDGDAPRSASRPIPVTSGDDPDDSAPVSAPEKSIRNIGALERKSRPARPPVNDMRDPSNFGVQQLPPKPKRPSTFRWWPWILAALLIVVLAGLVLFALRKTTVTVVPRSHTVVFDQTTSQFTAYPAATAATGTLTYTVVTSQLQDSQSVPATGTQDVETKAQGSVTVYNDYSTSPVKLIANTRFATPDGLIFRVPDAIVVPGKKGSTPGQVSVTLFADQAGQQYNIGPVSRFTVPGLQSTPAMYSNIYAQSTASTTGGFSGQQAGIDPNTLANTQAALRSQLSQEAQTAASAQSGTSTVVLPGLVQITYQDLPQTAAASGNAEVNEQATIQMPVFDTNSFTQAIAQSVGEDSQGTPLALLPGPGFAAQTTSASSTLGSEPLVFTLSGAVTLVWQVDGVALAQALAGHDENAFDTITAGFPAIEEAHARIEPFWKTTFPSSPAGINVVITQPQASQ